MCSTLNTVRNAFLSMTRLSDADPPWLRGRHSDIAISKGEQGMGMRNPSPTPDPPTTREDGVSPAW